MWLCFTITLKCCNIYFFNYSCVVYFCLYSDHVPLSSLIFSKNSTSSDSSLFSDINEKYPSTVCHENLYCGPFRNRTAIFAIFPDESGQCGVFCELFYIFFSSAIWLPLLFCLMWVNCCEFIKSLNNTFANYHLWNDHIAENYSTEFIAVVWWIVMKQSTTTAFNMNHKIIYSHVPK